MQNAQEVMPQIIFVAMSIVALLMLFFDTGVANFGVIQWIAVVFAVFGFFSNTLIIWARMSLAKKEKEL